MKQISRRFLHVMQSPSTSIPTSLNVSHLVKSVPEVSNGQTTSATTSFEVLDSTLLRVALAPSTELYTKRSSLLATFGDSVVSTLYLAKVLSRFSAFQRPFGYQKLISAAPVSALISSSAPLAVLSLDGSIDWVVVSNKALHTFTGDRLIVDAKRRQFLSLRNKFRTGRPSFSHTFLSGRGTVALSGCGQLYKINLQEGESFLALKDTLVAYSMDANNRNAHQPEYKSLPHSYSALEEGSGASKSDIGHTATNQSVWEKVKSTLHLVGATISHIVNADSAKYLKMQGPTTMLLQSPAASFSIPEMIEPNLNVNPLEGHVSATAQSIVDESTRVSELKVQTGMPGRPEDHLKVATVKDGKVVFESTSNFDRF